MSRTLIEGRDFSKCGCGNIKSAEAKQCRECYRKNNGHHAPTYKRSKRFKPDNGEMK